MIDVCDYAIHNCIKSHIDICLFLTSSQQIDSKYINNIIYRFVKVVTSFFVE